MISNLVLTGMYKIGVLDGKYLLNGEKTSIKDVPFIRYRFDNYGEEEIAYIKDMQSKFKYSVHLAEVKLSEDTANTMYNIKNNIDRIAIFVYIPVTDDTIHNGFSSTTLCCIEGLKDTPFDRVMLKDNSTLMDTISATKLKKSVAGLIGQRENQIGICSSPLSFCGEACLTAIQARDLIALYSNTDECKIPSANHECMNTCGCIRHTVVNSDINAPVAKTNKGNSKGKKASSGNRGNTLKKVSKAPIEWV